MREDRADAGERALGVEQPQRGAQPQVPALGVLAGWRRQRVDAPEGVLQLAVAGELDEVAREEAQDTGLGSGQGTALTVGELDDLGGESAHRMRVRRPLARVVEASPSC